MNTLTTEPEQEFGDLPDDQLPGRPRRRLLTRLTVPLLALLIAAAGFLGGIEVEKSNGTNSTGAVSASASASTLAKRFAGGTSGTGASPHTGGSSKSRSRSGGAPRRSSLPSAGSFGTAGGDTTGTISSISGKTIVLKETSGNSITVTLTSATSLKKELSVKRNSIRPGDTITVDGITGKGGSIKASSISDTGASNSSSTSSSSSTS